MAAQINGRQNTPLPPASFLYFADSKGYNKLLGKQNKVKTVFRKLGTVVGGEGFSPNGADDAVRSKTVQGKGEVAKQGENTTPSCRTGFSSAGSDLCLPLLVTGLY